MKRDRRVERRARRREGRPLRSLFRRRDRKGKGSGAKRRGRAGPARNSASRALDLSRLSGAQARSGPKSVPSGRTGEFCPDGSFKDGAKWGRDAPPERGNRSKRAVLERGKANPDVRRRFRDAPTISGDRFRRAPFSEIDFPLAAIDERGVAPFVPTKFRKASFR